MRVQATKSALIKGNRFNQVIIQISINNHVTTQLT